MNVINRIFLLLVLSFASAQMMGQVQFTHRLEVPTSWQDDDFIVLPKANGMVAFRVISERPVGRKNVFQYVVSDHELSSSEPFTFPVNDLSDLVGFDLDGELLYVFFQKGPAYNNERFIYEINLQTANVREVALTSILNLDLQDFLVFNQKAVFMGNFEYRPVIQIFDLTTSDVITVPGVFEKDANILQLRKDPELNIFDVLMSRRDYYKKKIVTILTYDTSGEKLREVKIDELKDPSMEIVEGLLTSSFDYKQALIGPYGLRRREAYQGIYFTKINEFGEYENRYYTIADFENFYNYLPEKMRERRVRALERNMDRGKNTPIRNVLVTREVTDLGGAYLVYNDLFISSSSRYMPRDGMYANSFYRMNPMMGGLNTFANPLWMDPRWRTSQVVQQYKFLASQFIILEGDGTILWDNMLPLNNVTRSNPAKFGEVSFDGSNLFYMYLDEQQLMLSQFRNGELVREHEPFEIELVNENERIRDTRENSLQLIWWYDNYYLLSGKQRVRFQNKEGKEEIREVNFFTKVKVEDLI
ncbi:transcriptional regulator [Lunatimonas salinarum]|uniref:transcriptional regulator n=1 Tax=Lunatimonas salinarum TaxID=1774590 RepID=UPI001FD7B1B7|nr:transcriptional regulator [Lunatimonas salinarum]